jgi:MFS family permease
MSTAPISLQAYRRLLRENRNFRVLLAAQTVSEIGDWLYAVAIYSLILEITGSAQAVALAFVLQVLPQFVVAPAAGAINDRIKRKQAMMIADFARAGIVFLMLFAQSPGALWFLYVLLLLETIFWAVFEPGRNAIIPSITRNHEELLVANGLSSTIWSVNLAIGSAIGGVLAAAFGRDFVFVLNAFSFIVSALLLKRLAVRETHVERAPPFQLRDLFDFSPVIEGMRYVRGNLRLLLTILVKAGVGFMGANWVLLPMFGERIYPIRLPGFSPESAGMLGMSLLMGCRGVGALLGPMIASVWTGNSERRFRLGIILGFLTGTTGYFALGYSSSLLAACLAVILAHSGGSICWVFSTTLLQLQTADRFRGRVFSTEFAFHMLTLSLTSYGAGLLVDSGMTVYTLAKWTGVLILVPGVLWAIGQRLWR